MKIDLVTGFLGSGKTTFIKIYAAALMEQGLRVGLLENDLGAVNVDALAFSDLEAKGLELEAVAGGCDADCHRRRFKTKLIALKMQGLDRIIVEPSGVFDVDEFFDVLREDPLDQWYEVGSVIAIVDAHLPVRLSSEAGYILASEIANAGAVVVSKTQGINPLRLDRLLSDINRALSDIKCSRILCEEDLWTKDWEDLTKEDLHQISASGIRPFDYEKRPDFEGGFDTLYVMNEGLSLMALQELSKEIFETSAFGRIFRIKGFAKEDGIWYEVNATAEERSVERLAQGQDVFIVIGEQLKKDAIMGRLKKESAKANEEV